MSTEIIFLKDDNIPEVAAVLCKTEQEVGWMLEDAKEQGRNKVMITVEHRDNTDGFGT